MIKIFKEKENEKQEFEIQENQEIKEQPEIGTEAINSSPQESKNELAKQQLNKLEDQKKKIRTGPSFMKGWKKEKKVREETSIESPKNPEGDLEGEGLFFPNNS